MLTPRPVLRFVASRYGKLEPLIFKEAEKLDLVRNGTIELTDLESDRDRVRMRLAREGGVAEKVLERINNINNFQDKYIVDKLALVGRSVCRILKNQQPFGTGFLVGEDVLLTNNHVIPTPGDAVNMTAEFDYELGIDQSLKRSISFKIDAKKFFLTSTLNTDPAIPFSGLDFTLIGLERKGTNGEELSQFKPVSLDGNKGKIIKGEYCVIIQHPNGLPKKIVLKDIAFFFETATRIVYESDTLPGSSGSVVLGLGTGEVVALHHSGLPRTNDQSQILTKKGTIADDDTPDEQIDWIGNEGIKITKIVEALTKAILPPEMDNLRRSLLQNTENVAEQLTSPTIPPKRTSNSVTTPATTIIQPQTNTTTMTPATSSSKVDFIITMINKDAIIGTAENVLSSRYNQPVKLRLVMPESASPDETELFSFSVPFSGNVHEEAQNLTKIPGILNAEADLPLALNADGAFEPPQRPAATESGFLFDDGLGTWNEDKFFEVFKKSQYIDKNNPDKSRKWNWEATNFNKLEKNKNLVSPKEAGIRLVQFDTGFTDHSKVTGGFDIDHDFNFLNDTDNATDPRTVALGKQPGHGTRTGSLLIGVKNNFDPFQHNGNEGLLAVCDYKLVPFRIAESVIIINRQQQLAGALDRAISQGFDIITMSMGLPPTITTAKMAKKAYDKGVIWCCAAGNEVQAVVAPAVFPGTIAVAASNPLDYEWSASSRGDAVDITAPGESVYVPIWNKDKNEDYAYGSGTSYATPHIAAAAAYWLAAYKDVLSGTEYAGWKRVEAFKEALDRSARRENNLPRKGFGHGILNIDKLLYTKPAPASKLKYAYNNWNEKAFLASLQAYGELLKTYWNKLHGIFFKIKRGGQEALLPATESMSAQSQQLERVLFRDTVPVDEAIQPAGEKKLLERYNVIQNLIQLSL